MASAPIGPPPPPVAVPPSCDATPASSPSGGRGGGRYPSLFSHAASPSQSAAPGLVTPRHKKSSRLLARELGKGLKTMAHWDARCATVQECVLAALTELETTLERAQTHQANNKTGLSTDVWSSEDAPRISAASHHANPQPCRARGPCLTSRSIPKCRRGVQGLQHTG